MAPAAMLAQTIKGGGGVAAAGNIVRAPLLPSWCVPGSLAGGGYCVLGVGSRV